MHLLETQGLSKSYNGRQVVKGVDLVVKRGEITGLLGPNGAGKTTTFYMVVGVVRPDKGKIIFDNQDITQLPIHERARFGMGYLSQEPSIFRKLTVEENIDAILETLPMSRTMRKKKLEKLLNELNIAHLSKNKAYTLSGGEARRLEITRALTTDPSFILLDEPFSLSACAKQQRPHASCLAHAVSGDITLYKLHGIVNCQTAGNRATG